MRAVNGKTLLYTLGAAALILFTIMAGVLRPLTQVSGHTHNRWGLNRAALLSEPAANDDGRLTLPVRAEAHVVTPVVVGAFLLVLKTRRTAFAPIPVRRLKRPARPTSPSLPSD